MIMIHQTPRRRAVLAAQWLIPLAVLVGSIGCGPSRPETVEVTGTVTVDGKAPPGAGKVYFVPSEAAEGHIIRPATADFDESGSYTVRSWEVGDGLVPGRYKVGIHCWETPPNMDGIPSKSYIAGRYQSSETSGLDELNVEPGAGSVQRDFDVSSQ